MESSDVFGVLARLTPRIDRLTLANIGWQCTCLNPRHAHSAGCTKTFSNSVSGSEDMTLRALKLWSLRGVAAESKADHKALWAVVLRDLPRR